MSRSTRAQIDLDALRHNYACFKALAPGSQVMAVVKADAYGHGVAMVSRALATADLMGVAYIDEALQVRAAGVGCPVVLLEGVMNADEYRDASHHGLDVVIHREAQVEWLVALELPRPVRVWLKVDTGMHRLGLPADRVASIRARLMGLRQVAEVLLMSHLACADEPAHPMSVRQRECFEAVTAGFDGRRSLANSAGVLLGREYHYDVVRPGIMLYGAAATRGQNPARRGLRPVMRLVSPIIAINDIGAGETVGYGASWVARRHTRVAIVAIGYGDGYPRHVNESAHVMIDDTACPLIGRVSMDMLAVDVTDAPGAQPGSMVELWGPRLPVEQVADWAGTLNYELLCQVTDRVRREYCKEA